MKSLAVRCPLCGHDNLFPVKYAGRMLSCAHCAEPLPVNSKGAAPVVAVAAPANGETAVRESGLRRLNRALTHGLGLLCVVVAGVIGGGWLGVHLAFRWGSLGGLVAWISAPAGAFFGFLLARWAGQGIGRLMGSYRLALPGLLFGLGAGLLFWGQSANSPQARLLAGELILEEWLVLSLCLAAGGLLLGALGMIFDAIINFTR